MQHVAYLLFLGVAISFHKTSLCILLNALKIGLELLTENLRFLERLFYLQMDVAARMEPGHNLHTVLRSIGAVILSYKSTIRYFDHPWPISKLSGSEQTNSSFLGSMGMSVS